MRGTYISLSEPFEKMLLVRRTHPSSKVLDLVVQLRRDQIKGSATAPTKRTLIRGKRNGPSPRSGSHRQADLLIAPSEEACSSRRRHPRKEARGRGSLGG
jgi:hypothetical protein